MTNLNIILGNKLPLKILRFFSNNPSNYFYAAKLKRTLKISNATIIKWLSTLKKTGVLEQERIGRVINYKINTENPFVKQLRVLFIITELEEIKKLKELCDEAYLFGSCARGEYQEDSDIDLLIITNENIPTVMSVLGKIKTSREIKPIILSQLDYSMLSKKDPPLYQRIEKDKIRLL